MTLSRGRPRPRLLDLFSGAGGAAVGYFRAGFDVVGVDIVEQPRYPFLFVQGDALHPPVRLEDFDVIHASPPCQAYSTTRVLHSSYYLKLIPEVRQILRASGRPYVIENVVGAPIFRQPTFSDTVSGVHACGSSFGLGVWRHRWFESSLVASSRACRHELVPEPIDVTGTGGPGGRHRKPRSLAHAQEVMGIDWMRRDELSEAVPPAFTEWLGSQLLDQLVAASPSTGEGSRDEQG